MFGPSKCTLALGCIHTFIGQKDKIFRHALSMEHFARVVPVDIIGIWRESAERSIEFVLGNKESRIIFVPDVVTEAVNTEKERIIRMWGDVREACATAFVAWILCKNVTSYASYLSYLPPWPPKTVFLGLFLPVGSTSQT